MKTTEPLWVMTNIKSGIALVTRFEVAKNRLDEITDEKQARGQTGKHIAVISDIERVGGLLVEFDEELWYKTVKAVIVYSKSSVTVTFKDGSGIHVDLSGK